MKNVLKMNNKNNHINMKGLLVLSFVGLMNCSPDKPEGSLFKPSEGVKIGLEDVRESRAVDEITALKEGLGAIDRSIDVASTDKDKKNDWEKFLEPPYMPAQSKIGNVRELYNSIIRDETTEQPKENFDTAPWKPMSEKHKGHHHKDHQKVKQDVRVKKETKLKKNVNEKRPLFKQPPPLPKQLPKSVKRPNLKRPVGPPPPRKASLKKPQAPKTQKPKKFNKLKKLNFASKKNLKSSRPLSKSSKKHLKQAGKNLPRPTAVAQQRVRSSKQQHNQHHKQQQHNRNTHQPHHNLPAHLSIPNQQQQQHHASRKHAANFRTARVHHQQQPFSRKAVNARNVKAVAKSAKVQGRNLPAGAAIRPQQRSRSLPVAPVAGRALPRPLKAHPRKPIRSRKVNPRKPSRRVAKSQKKKFALKPLSKENAVKLGVGSLAAASILSL